jgi:uncharacterized protein
VYVDAAGALRFDAAAARTGSFIDLRFEMDTLVVFHTCPHPLNPATEYPRKPVSFQIRSSTAVTEDDACKNHCPENRRGFKNTELYTLGRA